MWSEPDRSERVGPTYFEPGPSRHYVMSTFRSGLVREGFFFFDIEWCRVRIVITFEDFSGKHNFLTQKLHLRKMSMRTFLSFNDDQTQRTLEKKTSGQARVLSRLEKTRKGKNSHKNLVPSVVAPKISRTSSQAETRLDPTLFVIWLFRLRRWGVGMLLCPILECGVPNCSASPCSASTRPRPSVMQML